MHAHVVPRTYLKGFADKVRGVGVYSGVPGLPAYTEKQVDEVSTQVDFYTMYRADGTEDLALEAALSKLESKMRDALKVVRSNKHPDEQTLNMLALLAALQEVRSERNRHVMTRPLQQVEAEIRTRLEAQGRSPDEIREAVHLFFAENFVSGDFNLEPSNISALMVPQGLAIRYKFFRTMSKCIIQSDAHDFFTCDDPVTWTDPFHVNDIGFAFLSITAEVTYPLTRRHCLLMSYFPLLSQAIASAETVTTINARTTGNALREVYAQPKTQVADTDRFVRDIASGALRGRPLFPLLLDRPSRERVPDIGRLADELGIDRQYLLDLNKPFIDYVGGGAVSENK
jgi:hypothetical protein